MNTSFQKEILNKLGTIKNEILIYAVIGIIIINSVGLTLTLDDDPVRTISGIVMHFLSMVIFAGFGIFYVYAFLRLPSSAQELYFLSSADKILKEHDDKANGLKTDESKS